MLTHRSLFQALAVPALAVLLAPAARADAPNINKRGKNDKEFIAQVNQTIIKAARTSVNVKTISVEKHEFKKIKDGRTNLIIKGNFKGVGTGKAYTADVVVHIDTADQEKWEVLRIEYSDNSKNVAGFNRKNVDALVDKLNGK